MKKTNIISIILSVLYSSLMFIPIYISVARLPGRDQQGNQITVERVYYYSVLDKFTFMAGDIKAKIIVFSFIALCMALLTIAIICLIKKNNIKLQKANKVLLSLTSIVFAVYIISGFLFFICY